MLFYLFSNRHLAGYEFLLGYKYVSEVNREIVIYEEGTAQWVAKYMIYIHFIKNIIESFFVHRLAGRTVPIITTMWHALFYWVGLGVIVGFSLFHPDYLPVFFPPREDTFEQNSFENQEFTTYNKVLVAIFAAS